MPAKLVTHILMAAIFAVANARGSDPKPNMNSVGDQVYCLCGGCVSILNHCPHHRSECSTRAEMEDLIQKDVAAGKDETAILQDFILRYGVKVLATPPARGFNLAVWILPAAGLILGLGAVVAITRRWRSPAAKSGNLPLAAIDSKVLAAVEEEMKRSMNRS